MRLFYVIFLLLTSSFLHFSYAQDCFVILEDASGMDISPRLEEIELAACALIETMPEEYQDSFGIYYFGFYLQQDKYQEGLSAIINQQMEEIQTSHPYYLAIGINLNFENPKRIKLLINLPEEGNFSCTEKGDVGLLSSSLELKFRNDPNETIIINIINALKTKVSIYQFNPVITIFQ